MAKLIDLFRERLDAGEGFGVLSTLGMTVEHFEPGYARLRMTADAGLHNPMGTLHGGVYCDLADYAMGVAFFCTLEEGEAMTTIEMKINFLRPIIDGPFTAEARVVTRGKTTGFIECDVRDGEGRLAARASSTCYVLKGERAQASFEAMRRRKP